MIDKEKFLITNFKLTLTVSINTFACFNEYFDFNCFFLLKNRFVDKNTSTSNNHEKTDSTK